VENFQYSLWRICIWLTGPVWQSDSVRLIERWAILESVFPSVIPLSSEEVKAFLSDVSQLPEVRMLLKREIEIENTE